MIAGDQFDADPSGLTGRHRFDRFGSRWILHPLQPNEAEITAHMMMVEAPDRTLDSLITFFDSVAAR